MNMLKPAAGIAIVSAGCAAVQEAAKPRGGLELEQIISSGSFSQSRIRLIGEKRDSFRVVHTETDAGTETLAGARVPVDFSFYTGNAVLFGQTTDSNDASGVNIDGKIIIPQHGDVLLGIAMERDNRAGAVRHNNAFYVGKRLENEIEVRLGLADVDGVAEYAAHLNRLWGRNVAAVSLTLDEDSEGFATVVYGRIFDGERGNGFGCRYWLSTDFDEAVSAEVMLTTNTTLSRGSILAPVAIQDGRHDQKIFPNVMDYVPGDPTLLSERIGPGGTAVRLKYITTETLESGLVAVRHNSPGESFPMVGVDFGINSPVGSDETKSITPRIGYVGKISVVDYSCRFEEGAKPVHEVAVSATYRF